MGCLLQGGSISDHDKGALTQYEAPGRVSPAMPSTDAWVTHSPSTHGAGLGGDKRLPHAPGQLYAAPSWQMFIPSGPGAAMDGSSVLPQASLSLLSEVFFTSWLNFPA